MGAVSRFTVADLMVFGVTIVISVAIGVYCALSGGRQKTTSEYLLGGRIIPFIPVAISLMVSFESSIMMLGLPAEGYYFGTQLVIIILPTVFIYLQIVYVVIPLVYPLKITSAYEYLEYRYQSRAVRLVGCCMGVMHFIWYMAIVLFGPAIALEAVTGFPLWISIVVISLVAVIYTSIGGMKAVVWTDVFQAVIMFTGIFANLIKGTLYVGGAKKVWDVANDGGRIEFFNFDPDPRTRHTFWGLTFAYLFKALGFGFNQSTVQRISSTPSARDAKKMMLVVMPLSIAVTILGLYEGVVAYAYFQTKRCDPLQAGQITNPNQLLPYMVMDVFRELPGMPGLFLASLFAASLSTLSTGLSSVSTLMWTDMVQPLVGTVTEFKATLIAKILVWVVGLAACGLTFLVATIGGTLHQISGTILGVFSTPVAGMFLLGCFSPRTTAKGAIAGGIAGILMSGWISAGMNFSPLHRPSVRLPPASMDQCVSETYSPLNSSSLMSLLQTTMVTPSNSSIVTPGFAYPTSTAWTQSTQASMSHDQLSGVAVLYNISYVWIASLGLAAVVIVGYVTSLVTGPNKPGDVDPRYLLSFSHGFLFFMPARFKDWLSAMGTQFIKEEYKAKFFDPADRSKYGGAEMVVVASGCPDDLEERDVIDKDFNVEKNGDFNKLVD